ncbi:MAG: hypothetical protein LCH26_05425, partial [Proteobacteria bacterium]|nr:hypothetical protein [Pseudomonadota bacterium]
MKNKLSITLSLLASTFALPASLLAKDCTEYDPYQCTTQAYVNELTAACKNGVGLAADFTELCQRVFKDPSKFPQATRPAPAPAPA